MTVGMRDWIKHGADIEKEIIKFICDIGTYMTWVKKETMNFNES